MGVADDVGALGFDINGVQRAAAGSSAAVEGGDELANLIATGLSSDESKDLVDDVESRQGPTSGDWSSGDRLVAEVPHLLERGHQPGGQGRAAPAVAVDGQGADQDDQGGQVGQVGYLGHRASGVGG